MNSYSSPAPGFDNMLSCPYNSAHQILRHRMQTHLVKCRKSYPDVAMKTCPFDTTHKIPENEMKFHIDTCPNRGAMESYKYSVNERPAKEEPDSMANMSLRQMQDQAAKYDQDDEENWDDSCTGQSAYDPTKYVNEAAIIQQSGMIGKTPSERKIFREKERLRMNQLFDRK